MEDDEDEALAGLFSELETRRNSNNQDHPTTETEAETAVLSSSSITALQTLLDGSDGVQLWDYLSDHKLPPSVLVASLSASMESRSPHLSLLASRAYLSTLLSSSAPVHTLFDPITFFSLLSSLRHSTKPTVPSDCGRSQPSASRERKKKRKGRSGERGCAEEHTEVGGLLMHVLELVESSMSCVRLDRMTDGVKSLVETVVVVLESGIVQRLRRISDICFGILYGVVVRPEHGDQSESSAQVLRSLSRVMLSHTKSGLKSEVIEFVVKRMMPMGKGNGKVRKALFYLPRYLAMNAPEKSELRACAVETILGIVRVMEVEDQIGFVDYVVKMCYGKDSLRLLGVDLLLVIVMTLSDALGVGGLENGEGDEVGCDLDVKKCLDVIVERCSDSVAGIRSRALVNTGQAIEFLSKDSKNHSWLQKMMMHPNFNNLLRMRFVDDKAAVRKSVLVLIMKSTTLNGGSIDEEVLKMMAYACSDPLVSIRKAALLSLSEAFRKNLESKIITTWLHAVPPLIMDNETSIQEECANLFLELILDWISRVGNVKFEDNIRNLELTFPNSLLALMKEMCDGEIAMFIKKICTSLGKKNKLKASYATSLQNIITASETAWTNNDMAIEKWTAPPGAWLLLSELSPFASKAIGWKFLHHHWKLLDKENEVESHGGVKETELISAAWITDRVSLLQIISNVAMGLPQEPAADLAHNLLKRIEDFNMHLTEVDAHIKALRTLCKQKAVKPEEGDTLVSKWVHQVISKAQNILDKYLSKYSAAKGLSSSVTPQAMKKREMALESESTSQVLNAVFVIGSLVLICPSADYKDVIPLLHSIIASRTSQGKPKKLAGLIDSLKEIASSLYIQSWVTMGKICLADGKLAKRYIPLFVQELESDSAAMRNNILLVMGDFCVRHTALVDCYIPRIANLLRDPCEIIRMQTFTLLSRLMQRDYVKWRGVLFLRFLLPLVDESEKIRNLADFLFGNILKVKAPLLAYNSFVEAIFVLNDCHTHSGHSAKSKTEAQNFSLRGNDETSRGKRMHIYVSLLKQMAPEQLLATSAKLCAEILASASDGMLNLDDITAQCVLQDSLEILACKEMRIQAHRASDTTDMEEEGGDGGSLLAARGRAVTQVSKKNLIQHAVPIFIELKRLLESRNSPLTGCLMECLCVLLKDYKNEIEDILVADKQLQKELIYDLQKYEAAKARNAVNNTIRRTDGLISPANLRSGLAAGVSEKLGTAKKITSAVADVAAKTVARSVMKDINRNMPTPSVHTMSIPKAKTSRANDSRTTPPMNVLQSLRKRQAADFDAVA